MLPYSPPEPRAVQVMREYRQAIDAREEAVIADMVRRWLEIEQGLEADISLLAFELTRRAEAGEVITQQMIWRLERYKKIKAQLQAQIDLYNKSFAVGLITQAQNDAAMLGISSAQNVISVTMGPMGGVFDRINIDAVQAGFGLAGDGSPLYGLLKNDFPDSVDGILSALINGVARGQGAAQTIEDMMNGMGLGLQRAILIARTETARMYRTASLAQYRKSGVVNGFQRLVKKSTACLACLALDGQIYELAEDFTDHPRGKCMPIPIVNGVKPSSWQTGRQWFDKLPAADQLKMMGPGRYDLWKDGLITFDDLVTMQPNDTWGANPQVTPVGVLMDRIDER